MKEESKARSFDAELRAFWREQQKIGHNSKEKAKSLVILIEK